MGDCTVYSGGSFLHIFLPNFIILGSACYKQWAIVRCILGEESQAAIGCWCFVEKIHYVDNIVFILDTNHAISHLCKFYVNILFYFYNQILLLKEGIGHLEDHLNCEMQTSQ